MCHPATEDPSLASLSSYVAPRYEELRTLTSPEIRMSIDRMGIALVGR
jgi:predicted glycoside hydrolase/deacetylase ChbG (UPF0249 family)